MAIRPLKMQLVPQFDLFQKVWEKCGVPTVHGPVGLGNGSDRDFAAPASNLPARPSADWPAGKLVKHLARPGGGFVRILEKFRGFSSRPEDFAGFGGRLRRPAEPGRTAKLPSRKLRIMIYCNLQRPLAASKSGPSVNYSWSGFRRGHSTA